jgi:hypothetical protein
MDTLGKDGFSTLELGCMNVYPTRPRSREPFGAASHAFTIKFHGESIGILLLFY